MRELDPTVVVLVFYLYLLARWQYVKRPLLYLLGAAGIVFGMCGGFFMFADSAGVKTVGGVFMVIGTIVAFVGAIGACFGGELPVKMPGHLGATSTQTPAQPPQPPTAK